ncbi:hypothetical protein [Brevifollis gellanilyticus]|uniref:Uncharacterized protein n=1 Tax=Brevifollis gellanilyticus TaxID=748831 RepID=A0A512MEH0_9BACT|nr:hypothetical protein [Brevifollis gellanilyticus]GEP45106.1 hypothetical protein BGE01nite_43970 [Brevifollis gellanilyticus]
MSHNFSLEDGNTWEADVKRWLRIRYPNDFQAIPASDGGDAGIEGFCHIDHNVYQCYAVQAAYDTKTTYEHQRDKLTEDIGKFVDNSVKLQRLLPSGFQTRRYCFVVKDFRSRELVAHAKAKTEVVHTARLPYVANDFAILVQTRDDYLAEQRFEENRLISKLDVDLSDVAPDDIDDWETTNNSGVQNLNRKIPLFTMLTKETDIARYRRYWIERKICTDNALEKLRQRSAEAWEKLRKVKLGRERLLGREFGSPNPSQSSVQKISDMVAAAMTESVPNLEKQGAEALAEGLVGEWLQNCNLDFPSATTS